MAVYYYYLIALATVLFAMWAQIKVQTTFKKSSKIMVGMTGAAAARKILDSNGLYNVAIERVGGHLTDHYDPRTNVIRLSDSVYDSNTAAAVGVAAHEAGHAVQYAKSYKPIKLRAAIIPVCQLGSNAAMPLFLLGMILSMMGSSDSNIGYAFMLTGIVFYSLAVLFQLVTLPVEFNASGRAMKALAGSGILDSKGLSASRKVLTAAAMTYIAALFTSLVSLLRLVIIAMSNKRDR